jgi:hypothetical protein
MHDQYCDAWARATVSKDEDSRPHSLVGKQYRKSGALHEGTGANNGPMRAISAQTKAPTDNTLKMLYCQHSVSGPLIQCTERKLQ